MFWKPLRRRLKTHEHISDSTKVLTIFLFVAVFLLAAFVVVFGVTKIRAHYMFVLIPFPVVFFALIKPELNDFKLARIYGLSLVVMATLLVGGMVGKYVSEPLRCKRCQLLVPYKNIGTKIRDAGFKGGTIFAYYFPHDLAGNLRSAFPDTRIVSTKYPSIVRRPDDSAGQCLVIWMPAPGGVMDADGMSRLANKFLGTNFPVRWDTVNPMVNDYPEKPLMFEFDRTNGKKEKLHYMLYSPGRGSCR